MANRIIQYLRQHPYLGRIALYLIPDIPLTITISGIGPFRIRLRRDRSYWLRDPLRHEEYPLSALRQLTRPDDTVYDIGANIGLYARFLSRFGAKDIFCFEPMEANWAQLMENIQLGGLEDQVHTVQCALSDRDVELELQVDDMQGETAVLDEIAEGAAEGRANLNMGPKTEVIQGLTLDAFVQREDVCPPDVMKIDVEGAEMKVLQGAQETITQHMPRLLIEMHDPKTTRSVLSFLIRHGYQLAGKVEGTPEEGWHRFVPEEDIPSIKHRYDVHFCLAAKNRSELPEQIEHGLCYMSKVCDPIK